MQAEVESLELIILQIKRPVLDAEFAEFVVSAIFFICATSSSLNDEEQIFGKGESIAS